MSRACEVCFKRAATRDGVCDVCHGKDPAVYLSVSEGRYRIIQGGMPIHSDTASAAEALAIATRYKLKVADRYWDGDAGEWRERIQS